MKKKIIVISIFLLILIAFAVSYAYFVATINGAETSSSIVLDAGTLNINVNGGNTIFANGIEPSLDPFMTKMITVTGTNTTNDKYNIYDLIIIIDDNTFSNGAISYSIEGTNTSNNGELVPNKNYEHILSTDNKVIIGTGYFAPGTNLVHTYSLKMYFLETDSNQSYDMNKTFAAHITIEGKEATNYEPFGIFQVGDFVEYDAGTWTQAEINSIAVGPNDELVYSFDESYNEDNTFYYYSYTFGDFTVGQSRNIGAFPGETEFQYAQMYNNGDSTNKVALAGWRIFDIDEINGVVTLISAANPENYSGGEGYVSEYILTGNKNKEWDEKDIADEKYTKRNWSMYENGEYDAYNARVLTINELTSWYNKYIIENAILDYYTFQMIYSEPYLKYQNLIDNHTYYHFGYANNTEYLHVMDPQYMLIDDYPWRTYNRAGLRILVSIPLTKLDSTIAKSTKTVTLDGYYSGSETTKTYNVWGLNN